ncbi:MAG: hypothetical protein AWM53_01694 [Candidatus Dichloromethanomonas elyunquensis]|nr:MAG: hypothetical protein AWM53_01694 [Candidatus Dichloromethanomonas elyunquensis]
MKKHKVISIAIVILLLVLTINTFASADDGKVNVLEFSNVEKEILSRNQTVANGSSDYGDASFLNDAGQLSDRDLYKKGVSTEMANYLVVWTAEGLYFQYNSLSEQMESLTANKVLLEKNLQATKLREQLGMATELAVIEAEKNLNIIDLALSELELNQSTIRQTLNNMLSQAFDTPLEIRDVPQVNSDIVAAINKDEDLRKGLSLAFKVKLEHIERRQDDEKRKFETSFNQAYQNVLDKAKALEVENKKYDVVLKNFNTVQVKQNLGMVSSLQFQSEYYTFVSEKVALETAQNALFKAYWQYQWATRGLIVS